MKVLGIMESPKNNGNSSTLLKTVLEGAKASGAILILYRYITLISRAVPTANSVEALRDV